MTAFGVTVMFSSALGVFVGSVVIPVVVAALTATVALFLNRMGEAANRRRDRYAEAVAALVAWVEFPYRVRRRTDDDPTTLSVLAGTGHDLQQRLASSQAWISTESPRVARSYQAVRSSLTTHVGPALKDAWNEPPITCAGNMNLNGWVPGRRASRPSIHSNTRSKVASGCGVFDERKTVSEPIEYPWSARRWPQRLVWPPTNVPVTDGTSTVRAPVRAARTAPAPAPGGRQGRSGLRPSRDRRRLHLK